MRDVLLAVQVLTVTTSASAEDLAAADALVTDMAPSARRTYVVGGTQKYELPTSEVTLSQVSGMRGQARGARHTVVSARQSESRECLPALRL